MNNTKRLLSLVLAILMLLSLVSVLSACKDPQTPPDEEQPGDTPGTPDTPENPDTKPGEVIYSISIKTVGGMAMDGIMVYIYNTDGYIVAKNPTDENGNVSFTLPASPDYKAELSGVPEGYILKDNLMTVPSEVVTSKSCMMEPS